MFEKLSSVEERYEDISTRLSDPAVISDNETVSYTHLDVYKRQVLPLSFLLSQTIKREGEKSLPFLRISNRSCLLYTSRCV